MLSEAVEALALETGEGSLEAGVLRVMAELDTQPHQGEARVQDYVKPTFYLELQPEKETVVPGETVRATVRARELAIRAASGPSRWRCWASTGGPHPRSSRAARAWSGPASRPPSRAR